jgi:hypothetical protein
MPSRLDYLEGRATHREYYAQFVDNQVLNIVASMVGVRTICESTDEHLNDIHLAVWDHTAMALTRACRAVSRSRFEEMGDIATQSGVVCVAKEAARQIRDDNRKAEEDRE